MNIQEFKVFLAQINRVKLATITVETEPEMNKGGRGKPVNPFYGKVLKRNRLTIKIGGNYENSVNNRRVKEQAPESPEELETVASFEAQPLSWGTRVPGTPLIVHKDNHYLQTEVMRSAVPVYCWEDGRVMTDEEYAQVTPWIKRQDIEQTAERQGLETENAVVVRTFKLNSIKELKLLGEDSIAVG